MHVVLAMEVRLHHGGNSVSEAREGPAGKEKAERIMAEKERKKTHLFNELTAQKHLFADIFATYHPQVLPRLHDIF